MNLFRVLILSDIHIGKESDLEVKSRITSALPELPAESHPFEALKVFLKNYKIDLILNVGDLTEKGYRAGWNLGIRMLRELSLIHRCKLISVPGNHDYCFEEGVANPDLLLKNTLNYPTDQESLNNKFWSDGFCLYEVDSLCVLLCNSEHHLQNKEDLKKSSSFDDILIRRISNSLTDIKSNKTKIAIMHHHITQLSDYYGNIPTNDIIEKGDKLLEVLKGNEFLCVIHGHKHLPRFMEWNQLPILACGSFSSLENITVAGVPNCFHILDIINDGNVQTGSISTFRYLNKEGWAPLEDSKSKIKGTIGLGYSLNENNAIGKLLDAFSQEETLKTLSTQQFLDLIPEWPYMKDDEHNKFIDNLKQKGLHLFEINEGYQLFKTK